MADNPPPKPPVRPKDPIEGKVKDVEADLKSLDFDVQGATAIHHSGEHAGPTAAFASEPFELGADPDEGGEIFRADIAHLQLTEDPDAGGEIALTEDPDAGGEIFRADIAHLQLTEDPDAGGEIALTEDPDAGGEIFRADIAHLQLTEDPDAGGEISQRAHRAERDLGRRSTVSDAHDRFANFADDPDGGGELNTFGTGAAARIPLDRAEPMHDPAQLVDEPLREDPDAGGEIYARADLQLTEDPDAGGEIAFLLPELDDEVLGDATETVFDPTDAEPALMPEDAQHTFDHPD